MAYSVATFFRLLIFFVLAGNNGIQRCRVFSAVDLFILAGNNGIQRCRVFSAVALFHTSR